MACMWKQIHRLHDFGIKTPFDCSKRQKMTKKSLTFRSVTLYWAIYFYKVHPNIRLGTIFSTSNIAYIASCLALLKVETAASSSSTASATSCWFFAVSLAASAAAMAAFKASMSPWVTQ